MNFTISEQLIHQYIDFDNVTVHVVKRTYFNGKSRIVQLAKKLKSASEPTYQSLNAETWEAITSDLLYSNDAQTAKLKLSTNFSKDQVYELIDQYPSPLSSIIQFYSDHCEVNIYPIIKSELGNLAYHFGLTPDLKAEVKPTKPELGYKQLQRDMKAYNQTELVYEVYCDRVVFLGYEHCKCLETFFNNRNMMLFKVPDRGGYSISIAEAKQLNLPLEFSTYKLLPDSRKKPIALSKSKVKLLDELFPQPKHFKDNGEKIDYYLANPIKSFKYCQIWYSNPTGNDDDRAREGYIIKNTYPSSIQKYLKDSSRGTTKVFTDISEAENKCLEIDSFASKIHG